MTQLERLLALVRRTGLPTIIPGTEESEGDCIILPLQEYERLIGSSTLPRMIAKEPVSSPPVTEKIELLSLGVFQAPPVSEMVPEEASAAVFSLQDLLASKSVPESGPESGLQPKSDLSRTFPQRSVLEDQFVFEGIETNILSKTRQKNSSDPGPLDEFGQTLA